MKVTTTAIPGVLILEPKVFGDERGFFMESFNQRAFNAAVGHEVTFVQDNHSMSLWTSARTARPTANGWASS
jgi:dTDP-4-dehydrorhamnose 3,5-epimerase